ncbi:MAG: ABC transporter permease [Clostridiales bacterium]|jgi:ribose/xylose/arabinose/galactoside ABC-type transport system permease subunit|nr:ABC transporter permease [Clostridiales bacterium]
MENTNRLRKILTSKEFTLFVTLVAIVLLFGSISPNGAFLKPRNIRSILDSMTIYTLFAVGGALVIISGNIDLSPSYVGAACGVLLAKLLNDGVPWYLVVPICLLMGAAFGVLNAVLINEFKIQSFIATLTTGTFIAKGLVYLIPDGVTYQIKDPVVVWYSTGKIFGFVPITMIISIAIIVIFGIVLAKTRFGRSVYLIGGNANAARLAGLKPKKLSYIIFACSGALGALAGMLYAGRLKSGSLVGTVDYGFPAVTAVILGGVSLGGGTGNMLGCFLGLLIINGFNNGLLVMGVKPYWQDVASGVLLLVALTIDYFSTRERKIRTTLSSKGGMGQ